MRTNWSSEWQARFRRSLLASALGVAFVPIAGQVGAQDVSQAPDPAVSLPPLRVGAGILGSFKTDQSSSPKMTAPLLDTPQTITVIPRAVIEEQNANTLTEVLRNTPGISFNAGENGFSSGANNFSLRGFDASGNIFIDNSRDSGSYTRDVFNTDRVEVVKGAAADNGRGGAGGYVNMVSKTPGLTNFYGAEITVGFDAYNTEARKRATVDVNQAIGTSTAIRLNAMVTKGGVAGREMATTDAWGIAPTVMFGLGTDFRALVSYEHLEIRDRPDWGVPGATMPGLVTSAPSTFNAPRNAYYGLSSDYDNTVYDAITARLEYDFSNDVKITNQTRWARVGRSARFTVPTGFVGPVTATSQTQYYDRVNNSITNLTNVSARFRTGTFEHNLSAGIEITSEQSNANRGGTNNPPGTNIFDPNPDRSWGVPFVATEKNSVQINTAAIYAFDTMKISPQWEITGGLRAEWYSVKIGDTTLAGTPNSPLDGFSQSSSFLAGRIGVVYKPAENGSVYAAFSVSGQPPASFLSNPDISRAGTNAFPGFIANASNITNYNYELGTKWDVFNKRLALTAALFRTEKAGVPIVGIAPGAPPGAVQTLQGTEMQVVQGLELSASGQITEGWNIFAGLALMDSRRYHSAYSDAVLLATNPGDYALYTSTNGNALAFTPSFTANLWTTYRFPFGLTIGGGLQHVSASYLGRPDDALRVIPNGRFGMMPGYTVVNAMMAYEITENVVVRFNINNLFDERYVTSSNWAGSRVALGPPQTFVVSTAFKF
jgi:catecholate siderophore receptor